MFKFGFRLLLIAPALIYLLPHISGVSFHGMWWSAALASLVFNLILSTLEWILGVVSFGINIATLGIGILLTNSLQYAAGLLLPSVSLYVAAQILPKCLHVSNPLDTLVAGLILGGIMRTSVPARKK